MEIPVKLRPDPKARGRKPQRGWYVYDSAKRECAATIVLDRAHGRY